MSITSFVQAAKKLYDGNYYNEALCLACIAIDACASQKYPGKKVTERYKFFLTHNFSIISKYGFPGIDASCIRIKVNDDIPSLKKDESGYVDMVQIIYHVLRCGLVHNCDIESSIVFTDKTLIGDWKDGVFYLPKALLWGLIEVVNKIQTIAD